MVQTCQTHAAAGFRPDRTFTCHGNTVIRADRFAEPTADAAFSDIKRLCTCGKMTKAWIYNRCQEFCSLAALDAEEFFSFQLYGPQNQLEDFFGMQQLFLLYFFGLNVKARDVIIRHEQGKAAVQRKPIVFQSGFQYGHGFAGRAAAGADGKGVRVLGETKLQLFDKIGYDSGWGPCIDRKNEAELFAALQCVCKSIL